FQLLTGRVPFDRENPLAVALAHLKDPVPSARRYNASLTEGVDRVLMRGMAKDPAQRFTQAIEMLGTMSQALGQAAAAPAPSTPPQGQPAAPGQRPTAPAGGSTLPPRPAGATQLGRPTVPAGAAT